MKIWHISEICASQDKMLELLLEKRQILNPDMFLTGTLDHLHDPYLMKDMDKAIKVIQRHEMGVITIYGDYDADGVTSTALLYMVLRELRYEVNYHIPDRLDGYGLTAEAITALKMKGTTLILTCDCGITAVAEVEYAKSLGMEIVITDHHQCAEVIPNADAVVNPHQPGCNYPFRYLAGVGVAFKLATALYTAHGLNSNRSQQYLDIVAIGTIADMVDLVDENRLIAKYGIRQMKESKNTGISFMLKALELNDKEITPYHVGFVIAPCINATGRLYTAHRGVELLTTDSPYKALKIGKELIQINTERQDVQAKAVEETLAEVLQLSPMPKVLVYYKPGIQEGIVGLVAGKVREKVNRPVVILTDSEDAGILKGSGRSIDAYDMHAEISRFKHLCLKFGGHPGACGLSIRAENWQVFADNLNEFCTLADDDLTLTLDVDFEVDANIVNLDLVEILRTLEPFGKGNRRPLFSIRDVQVENVRFVGNKGQHLKLVCDADGTKFEAIAWNMSEHYKELGTPMFVNLAFYPELNTWNNRTTLQLKVEDITVS